jgi:hypothetical protein
MEMKNSVTIYLGHNHYGPLTFGRKLRKLTQMPKVTQAGSRGKRIPCLANNRLLPPFKQFMDIDL